MACRASTAPNVDTGSKHWWSLLATWMCGLAEPEDFGSSWSFTALNSKRVNSSVFQQPPPKPPASISCCTSAAAPLVKQPDKRLLQFPANIVPLPHLSIPLRTLNKKSGCGECRRYLEKSLGIYEIVNATYVSMYVCRYVCMYVCMYVCIYIHKRTYIHTIYTYTYTYIPHILNASYRKFKTIYRLLELVSLLLRCFG